MYTATFVNDLEAPAFKVVPALRELRDDLRKFGFQARDRTEIGPRSDRVRRCLGLARAGGDALRLRLNHLLRGTADE